MAMPTKRETYSYHPCAYAVIRTQRCENRSRLPAVFQMSGVQHIDREAWTAVSVPANHRVRCDQHVDDCLFGRLDDGLVERIHGAPGQEVEAAQTLVRSPQSTVQGAGVGGRERQEDVAGEVAAGRTRT